MIPNFSRLTRGIFDNFPNYAPLVTGGVPIILNPTPKLNLTEDPSVIGLGSNLNLSPQQRSDLIGIATLRNLAGENIIPSVDGFIAVGDGYKLGFDPNTLQGRITPALSPNGENGQADLLGSNVQVYTGTDVRLLIEASEIPADGRRYAKQLLEATTISVSVHREVAPVRAGGYINPKGFALGTRTIAGTLIVTQFTVDVLFEFLQGIMLSDGSKDSAFTKIDQLPPFNITMLFTNESGYASQRRLLGVKFVTDGTTYSIQDMMVEQVLPWMALDYTPLMPFRLDNLYQPTDKFDQTTRRERVPTDLMR